MVTINSLSASKPQPSSKSAKFIPVNLELLNTGQPLDFALYVSSPQAGRVMILKKGQKLDPAQKMDLTRQKVRLYILRADQDKYRVHLEANLKELLRSDQVDDSRAAGLAYVLSLQVMEAAFERPDAETLGRAQDSLRSTTDLILARDQTFFILLEMTRNSSQLHVHSCNVAFFGLGLAKALVKENRQINLHALAPALFFHDLGLVTIDRSIIDKPGPLTPEEWEKVKEHPAIGRDMLAEAGFLTQEAEVILHQHHERLDGSGYPYQLQGAQVHFYARICAVADVYDALTSDRSYKKRLTGLEAAKILMEEMTEQLDQDLVRRFIKIFRR
ncbi:MAG: HD domain-containing protein [Deltaproteobacteria bacterium]|nr:HD domain-containing protein [Deltaproteobacteria bacterium]